MNVFQKLILALEKNRFGFIAPIAVFVVALGSIAGSYALFKDQLIGLGLVTISCILCETFIISQSPMKAIFYSALIASFSCIFVMIAAFFG